MWQGQQSEKKIGALQEEVNLIEKANVLERVMIITVVVEKSVCDTALAKLHYGRTWRD